MPSAEGLLNLGGDKGTTGEGKLAERSFFELSVCDEGATLRAVYDKKLVGVLENAGELCKALRRAFFAAHLMGGRGPKELVPGLRGDFDRRLVRTVAFREFTGLVSESSATVSSSQL